MNFNKKLSDKPPTLWQKIHHGWDALFLLAIAGYFSWRQFRKSKNGLWLLLAPAVFVGLLWLDIRSWNKKVKNV